MLNAATLGYIGLAIFAAIVLTPFAIGVVHVVRTTRWSDLVPRFRRVQVVR